MSEGETGSGQQLEVDPVVLGMTADRLDDSREALAGVVTALGNRVASSSADWTGTASGEFGRIMERWNHNARKLDDALLEIVDRVRNGGQRYAAQEEEHANEVAKVAASNSLLSGPF
ncbi:WXG100 family type VII secretion target [Rhodococcus artemisiae]|uniref:WXG100 family type VII secretion target n=1 Tax=Rhodococcus artemisiae TaxID=714159 RepID=A0ABU7LKQ1_9NOCA|nr:WXG100 family type VII secretion target [Rhodococcus artemisiae]MEE2062095.1 WXG100 family type VII secretion target [Rhodococcus artemisiae]